MSSKDYPSNWRTAPPGWMNKVVAVLLKTPVIHHLASRSVLLLRFTGRSTHKAYTTPVSYVRSGDTLTLMTKTYRLWWKNFIDPAPVAVYLGRKTHRGTAQSHVVDNEAMLADVEQYLTVRSRDAQFYGVSLDSDGKPNRDDIRRLLGRVVLVTVALH